MYRKVKKFWIVVNKKLLMWYKKWKSGNVLMLIGGEKYKKRKKKKRMNSVVLFCILSNKAVDLAFKKLNLWTKTKWPPTQGGWRETGMMQCRSQNNEVVKFWVG